MPCVRVSGPMGYPVRDDGGEGGLRAPQLGRPGASRPVVRLPQYRRSVGANAELEGHFLVLVRPARAHQPSRGDGGHLSAETPLPGTVEKCTNSDRSGLSSCCRRLGEARSSSWRPNRLLCQMCGWALAGGFFLDYLWLPTWSKPADAPSRCAGLEDWRPKLPEYPMPWEERIAPEAQREINALLTASCCLQDGGRGKEAAPPPWRRWGATPTSLTCPPVELLPPPGKGGLFLEIFAGAGVWAKAIEKKRDCGCLPAIDLVEGPWHLDLRDDDAVLLLSSWIRHCRLRWVHFGTPCSTFSCALRGATCLRSKCDALGDERLQEGAQRQRHGACNCEIDSRMHTERHRLVLGEPAIVAAVGLPRSTCPDRRAHSRRPGLVPVRRALPWGRVVVSKNHTHHDERAGLPGPLEMVPRRPRAPTSSRAIFRPGDRNVAILHK